MITLMEDVARGVLLPRLGSGRGAARLKAPGEVVTEADTVAERALTEGLRALLPQATVVGEESAHAEPRLLEGLAEHEWAWIVDPLDGTRHFAAGEGPFGIMVGLLHRGACEGAWIHLPLSGDTATAWRGRGAVVNGERAHVPPPPAALRGGLLTRFFPEAMRRTADAASDFERTDGRHHCAARRYVDLVLGTEHFAAYWRTLPWDHAPGVLLAQEAGGVAVRFDGSDYVAADVTSTGLLVAADEPTWTRVRRDALGLD